VTCLRRLVAGLSPRKSVFVPGSIRVGLVAEKVALRQTFPRILRFRLSVLFRRGSPYLLDKGLLNCGRRTTSGTLATLQWYAGTVRKSRRAKNKVFPSLNAFT
jgi:hypothetical protein